MKSIISISAILIISFLTCIEAHAGTVGKFTSVEGRVDITSPGQKARPASVGDEVYEKDGIKIFLNPESTFPIEEYELDYIDETEKGFIMKTMQEV